MGLELRRFRKDEVYLTSEDAYAVLKFYFLQINILPNAITDEDRNFAQALLLAGIDSSYEFGLVKIVFDTFYMKVPKDFNNLSDMVKDFIKQAAKDWWKHATSTDLEDPEIYEYVRNQIRTNFTSTWRIREQTGELIY